MSESRPSDPVNEHLQALGQLVSQWTYAELMMTRAMGAILGNMYHADVIANALATFNARRDVLMALARGCIPDEGLAERFCDILDKLGDLSRRRGNMVHNLWLRTPRSSHALLALRKPKAKTAAKRAAFVKQGVKDIHALCAEISAASTSLSVAIRDLKRLQGQPASRTP